MTGPPALRNLKEVLRDGMVERSRIVSILRRGPRTIPELATELGRAPFEVTKWVMAMRRFGEVRDLPKGRSDDYFRYELTEAGR